MTSRGWLTLWAEADMEPPVGIAFLPRMVMVWVLSPEALEVGA